MPIPIPRAVQEPAGVARAKAEQVRRLPAYLFGAVLAGAYVGVAVVVLSISAPLAESSEIHGGHSESKPLLVASHTSVADSAVGAGDDPGDGPFDHRPPTAVVVDEDGVPAGAAGYDGARSARRRSGSGCASG